MKADKKEYKSQATYGMAFSKMFSAMAKDQRKREEAERKKKEQAKSKKVELPKHSTATYGGAFSGMGEKFNKEKKRLEKQEELEKQKNKKKAKKDKVLLGYSGSWAFGVSSFYKMEALKEKIRKNKKDKKAKKELEKIKKLRAEHGTPVYVSKEKYEKIKEHQKLHEYDSWL